MKELIEDIDREKALKDVAYAMAKEKSKATKKKAQYSEKARLVAEEKLAEQRTDWGVLSSNWWR